MRLNAANIAKVTLPPGRTDAIFFDDTLKGFGLRLRIAADRRVVGTWVLQWKRAGASKRIVLGPANVLSAEQARARAKKLLAAIALDRDAWVERREHRDKLVALHQMERRLQKLERLIKNLKGAVDGQRRRTGKDGEALAAIREGKADPPGSARSHRLRANNRGHDEG
jgi:hypothetical protein